MKTMIGVAALASLALVASIAGAHPRAYVAGEILGICFTDGGALTDVPSISASCWNSGHVPAVNNQATVSINDNVQNPVGGFVCQDTDGDVVCGGSANELQTLFCGSTTIKTPAAGGLWQPAAAVPLWIFVNGPLGGALDLALGGQCASLSTGSAGTINHS